MTSRLRIIVTGLIAQHPKLGGVTWDYLQYVLGLAHAGHDVYYFEDSGQWPYNLDGGPSGNDWIAHDGKANVEHLSSVMAQFGLAEKWAYHFPIKPRWFGLSGHVRKQVLESADLLVNVSGSLRRPADYRRVPRLIYIDSDPVFTQLKLRLPRGQIKFKKRFFAHDMFFTFGERISGRVPGTDKCWHPTRQPIVLSEWETRQPHGSAYTTVMSWTSYKPLIFRGQSYGQKDVEFARFLGLPREVHPVPLEVALGGTEHVTWQLSGQAQDNRCATMSKKVPARELLRRNGWQVADAATVCRELNSYRGYIWASKAEWSVAKSGYVRGSPGWFSCRSACYLAAGRPVVVEDTGFGHSLPVGEGILAFSTLEEATNAIRDVEGNYAHHAKAARAIAHEYFASDKVLKRLVDDALNEA